MRIVVFHQHYLAPGQGGGSRFNELSRFWCEAGHEVIVVAGSVTYSGKTKSEVQSWKLYVEEPPAQDSPQPGAGPRIWRCWVPNTYGGTYFERALAFLGYMLTAAWVSFFLPRPDIVIATSPPLVAVFPAWVASRIRSHRCGERDARCLHRGQLMRIATGHERIEAELLEQPTDASDDLLTIPTNETRAVGEVLTNRSMREQPCLVRDVGHAAAQPHWIHAVHVLTIEQDATGSRVFETVDEAQHR